MANRDINAQKHCYSDRQINLRVLLDLDQVLADFEGHFLKVFRRKYPDEPYTELEHREGFYIKEQYEKLKPGLGEKCENLWKVKGFFQDLEEVPGSIAAAKEMAQMEGVDVFICTSPIIQYKYCIREKYNWVAKHLGKDWVEKIIMTRDKTMVAGHILIDDKQTVNGVNPYPMWEHVVFSACHNQKSDLKGKRRLENWTDGSWKDLIEDFKKRI